jgi:uncharacterized protein (TIGR03437 family)
MNRIAEYNTRLSGIARVMPRFSLAAVLFSAAAWGATFGTVVPIDIPVGGHVSDIVLDEPRGVLYIANFTARRIDVMSLADKKITSSINVQPLPTAMALSPNGAYLVVTHLGGDPGFPLFPQAQSCPNGGLSVITLGANSVQPFCLGDGGLGVAFGNDDQALIVTRTGLILFDPLSGAIQSIGDFICDQVVNGVAPPVCAIARALPTALGTSPTQIIAASAAAARDGFTIYGQAQLTQTSSAVLRFRYDVRDKNVVPLPSGSATAAAPSTVSVNRDGSRFMAGSGLFDRNGNVVARIKSAVNINNLGSHVIDSLGNASYPYGIIYGQIPDASGPGALTLFDGDNLTVRQRIQLPENLTGRSVLNSTRTVLYAASDSGVLILPVGALNQEHLLIASKEDLVFRSNTCEKGILKQEFDVVNPGGGRTRFQIAPTDTQGKLVDGISVTSDSVFTPAHVTVTVDLNKFQKQKGTTTAFLIIASPEAVNLPDPVRVLVNNRDPDQRGTFVNIPGNLVDILSDPARDRYYVLRQQKNDVQVYDSSNNNLIATLRTSTTPTTMTITMDRRYLLVGHDDSQFANVYDLNSLAAQQPIVFPVGHYPNSIAASNSTILAASRIAGAIAFDLIQFPQRQAFPLPSLGIYQSSGSNTALTASADGRVILAALADGNVFLYNDSLHTFTTSRKDFAALSGAYAASNNGLYLVDNNILNSSLVPIKKLDAVNFSSGFVFAANSAFLITRGVPADPPPPTIVCHPVEGIPGPGLCIGEASNAPFTFKAGAIVPGAIQTVTGLGPDKFDPSVSDIVRPARIVEAPLAPTGAFTRTLAALRDQSALVALTDSGVTVIPWNYDAPVPIPQLNRVVSAADQSTAVAPGTLISVIGSGLPTALGDACLTANGATVPLLRSVSATEATGQLPFNIDGNTQLTLRTQGGVSDNLNITIRPTAPSVFRGSGESADGASIFRAANNMLVSESNPVREGDDLVIFATGLGRTTPAISAGEAAPSDPLSVAVTPADVSLDGIPLQVVYAGLTPGGVGVYQINVRAPYGLNEGQAVPLVIRQGGMATTVAVPVAVQ